MISAVFDWLMSVMGPSKRAKKKRSKPPLSEENKHRDKDSNAPDDVWNAVPIDLYWECLGLVCELSKGIAQAEAVVRSWRCDDDDDDDLVFACVRLVSLGSGSGGDGGAIAAVDTMMMLMALCVIERVV